MDHKRAELKRRTGHTPPWPHRWAGWRAGCG
jgi:hypothetical protein